MMTTIFSCSPAEAMPPVDGETDSGLQAGSNFIARKNQHPDLRIAFSKWFQLSESHLDFLIEHDSSCCVEPRSRVHRL